MATKTLEEMQQLLTEALDVKENLQSSQATRLRSLRAHQEQLEGLAELYSSGSWPPGYVLSGQDLFNVIRCVQYVLLEIQIHQADKIAEEIRQRQEPCNVRVGVCETYYKHHRSPDGAVWKYGDAGNGGNA